MTETRNCWHNTTLHKIFLVGFRLFLCAVVGLRHVAILYSVCTLCPCLARAFKSAYTCGSVTCTWTLLLS